MGALFDFDSFRFDDSCDWKEVLFVAGKTKVKLKGNVQLQQSLETVKNTAEETGLEPQHISTLLDAAASGYFGVYLCFNFVSDHPVSFLLF